MRKGYWLMGMALLWITFPQSTVQAQETEKVFEDVGLTLGEMERFSSRSESANGSLSEVDYLGRMETVLLRYKALQKRLKSVLERNKERFEAEFAELLEKSTPLELRVTSSNLNIEDEVEIIDLRECAIGRNDVEGDRVAFESSWPAHEKRCFPQYRRKPGNPILELQPLGKRLFELSETLEDIAEEILTCASELVGGN